MKQLKKDLLLYHGSFCIVDNPILERCAKFKDFGQGFYLTTSLEQARSFSKISASKAKNNHLISVTTEFAFVSHFKVSDISDLKCFAFETANIEWLHCIVSHRRNGAFTDIRKQMENYDVIGGKIANDDTNTTITAYMGNVFGQMGSEQADNMCISLLLPERLQDQFCFRSPSAISKLQFIKSEKVSLR
jgi:hypothetical protein